MNAGNSTATNVFLFVKQRLSLRGATVVALASGMFVAGAVSTAYGQWPPEVTYPQPLNTNAASATGWNEQAQLTTDGARKRIAVRESNDNLRAPIGPDIIGGDLQSVVRFGRVGDITAYGVGMHACNIGDERVSCIASANQHPLTAQSMYRLKDGRFEQIGMSWVWHYFYAVSLSLCTPCNDPTNGSELGVGCSDPVSCFLNGVQSNMSFRSDVNAYTGLFPYPATWGEVQTLIDKRLQVHDADLDPALNDGALYFIQGSYVAADDAAAGNTNNNASYRPVVVDETEPNVFTVFPTGITQRQQPAIRAWQDTDPSVVETDVHIPGEGLFILAAKATEITPGTWRYSYALQNINSDRSGQSFAVPLPQGSIISNVGFHDVDYHSGEIYDGTDWPGVVQGDQVTWFTDAYGVNANANALRYSTLYNFRFDANAAPVPTTVTLGLFKPGFPTEVYAATVAPVLILYVDADSSGPVHDGSSWCSAYLTLQDALNPVTPPAIIRVADGTYKPDQGGGQTPGDRDSTFEFINGVTIEGGYAGCGAADPNERDIELHETILSGDLDGDDVEDLVGFVACFSGDGNPYDTGCGAFDVEPDGDVDAEDGHTDENVLHVVTGDNTDSTAVLDGVTIMAGNADAGTGLYGGGAGLLLWDPGSPTVTDCTFKGNFALSRGAGVYNDSGDSVFTGCTFTGNRAQEVGGGIHTQGGTLSLRDCTFTGNRAANSRGGAMILILDANATVTDCRFIENTASQGGAIDHQGDALTITRCVFLHNSAVDGRGGALNNDVSTPTIVQNTVFYGNAATTDGGAVYTHDDDTYVNCAFTGNHATGSGGAFGTFDAAVNATNCTFTANTTDGLGGAFYLYGATGTTITNSVLWGNSDSGGMDESAQIHVYSGTPTVNYSVVQGGWTGAGGTGNSSSDPMFVDADGPDYVIGTEDDDVRLRVGSPATDAGDNTAVPADTYDLDEDENTTEPIPIDLSGNPRFIDDPAVVDTGSGTPADRRYGCVRASTVDLRGCLGDRRKRRRHELGRCIPPSSGCSDRCGR